MDMRNVQLEEDKTIAQSINDSRTELVDAINDFIDIRLRLSTATSDKAELQKALDSANQQIIKKLHHLAFLNDFGSIVHALTYLKDVLSKDQFSSIINSLDKDKEGYGLIHTAVHNANAEAISALIKLGGNPNLEIVTPSNDLHHGGTALHLVMSHAMRDEFKEPILRVLIDNKADPNKKNNKELAANDPSYAEPSSIKLFNDIVTEKYAQKKEETTARKTPMPDQNRSRSVTDPGATASTPEFAVPARGRSVSDPGPVPNIPKQRSGSFLKKAINFFKSEPKEIQILCAELNKALAQHRLITSSLTNPNREVKAIAEVEFEKSLKDIQLMHNSLSAHVNKSKVISKKSMEQIKEIGQQVKDIETFSMQRNKTNYSAIPGREEKVNSGYGEIPLRRRGST